jgi:hypothetical protein
VARSRTNVQYLCTGGRARCGFIARRLDNARRLDLFSKEAEIIKRTSNHCGVCSKPPGRIVVEREVADSGIIVAKKQQASQISQDVSCSFTCVYRFSNLLHMIAPQVSIILKISPSSRLQVLGQHSLKQVPDADQVGHQIEPMQPKILKPNLLPVSTSMSQANKKSDAVTQAGTASRVRSALFHIQYFLIPVIKALIHLNCMLIAPHHVS